MKWTLGCLIISGVFFSLNANAQVLDSQGNRDFPCLNKCQAADAANTLDYCQQRCAYQKTVATKLPSTINSACARTCLDSGNAYPLCQAQCVTSKPSANVDASAPNRYQETRCQHNCLANGINVIACQQRCSYQTSL